jgi:L-alanine-DL-glutamate epimerase-like enolase superfamily enzyme
MRRRMFLSAACALPWAVRHAWADDLPSDVRITRVVAFEITCQRSKFAGKNARLDVHGDSTRDRLVRLFTNADVEGLGDCRMSREDAQQLVGRNPFEYLSPDRKSFTGPIGPGTMPLWDLAGKLLKKPVYQLLGDRGPSQVPLYDGSIYFADLLPQYADRWQDRFREEIDMARKLGHRAVKVKIGRGNKWMPRAEGDRRDIEVLQTIRQHAGSDLLIGIDANNGYDLAGAKRLFGTIGELNIAFAEEMFPEAVEPCLEFKEHLRKLKLATLVADGETQSELAPLLPLMKARAVDIYQLDMHQQGFEGILAEAAAAREHQLTIAPHNWGHLVAFYMQLHVGRAIDNFYRAEHDPLSSDVLVADGFKIESGQAAVPDTPGCGLTLNNAAFERSAKVLYDVS